MVLHSLSYYREVIRNPPGERNLQELSEPWHDEARVGMSPAHSIWIFGVDIW